LRNTKRVCGRQPSAGIDEQHHTVDHLQHALDLAAEISVTGRVDDVDLHLAITNGGVLRHDRDTALALEIHRVHDAVAHLFVLAKGP
jgi:hypothetical protein